MDRWSLPPFSLGSYAYVAEQIFCKLSAPLPSDKFPKLLDCAPDRCCRYEMRNDQCGTYNYDPAPIVVEHDGVLVVRDDLFPGGTKARFLGMLFNAAEEVVYASPAEGGAQVALATVARKLGKQATIFVARRAKPHPRTLQAAKLGAKIVPIAPGYLSVVQARAREYCVRTGARLMPFGADMPEAVAVIAAAARSTGIEPHEVWCASGSGVLARGLAAAWPKARRQTVQVGRTLTPGDVAGATIHIHPRSFGHEARSRPPFPTDPHYEAKAWELIRSREDAGRVLFWNVAGPAV